MRRKVNKKKISINVIISICLIAFFLTIGVGYSYLQAQVKISGKSTIIAKNPVGGNYPKGNSTMTIQDKNNIMEKNINVYRMTLTITNQDADISSWAIAFDIPSNFCGTANDFSFASSIKVENGRLIIYPKSGNASLAKGTSLNCNLQLQFEGETDFSIKNLTLNGLLVKQTN